MMRTAISILSLVAIATIALAQPAPIAGQAKLDPVPLFAIKADPRLAKPLNELLNQIGAPTSVIISRMGDGSWVRDDCAGRPAVTPPDATRSAKTQTANLAPCVKVRRNLQTKVRSGDTWDGLVARLGLPAGARDEVRLQASPGGSSSFLRFLRNAITARFSNDPPIGATALADEAAAWTMVQVKATSGISTLAALSGILGAKLGCVPDDGKSVRICLAEKGVEIIAVSQTTSAQPPVTAAAANPEAGAPLAPTASGAHCFSLTPNVSPICMPWFNSSILAEASVVARSSAADAQATVFSASPPPPPPPPSTSKVADGQWPYDRARVLKLLQAAEGNPRVTSNVIGVMDVGLADDTGRPLKPALLVTDTSGDDDQTGATALGMCSGLDAAALQVLVSSNDEAYSHGAVIASLAAFVDLKAPDAAEAILPHILFYRLYGPPCPPQGAPSFNTLVAIKAFDHLQLTAPIINDSSMDTGVQDWITDDLIKDLRQTPVLLVTAAGNQDKNLDQQTDGFCPACIRVPGNHHHDDGAASRTIVVGAATEELIRAGHSNFGPNTVQIFAPGRAIGALDLLGDDAGQFAEPASSYAAPQVARAIAIVQSLSGLNLDQAAHRTFISTWPFFDESGKPVADISGRAVGVLDLAKAAAVRTYAVETMQVQPDGRLARKTYIGDIKGGLKAINAGMCQLAISEDRWQALIFSPLDATHTRIVALGRNPIYTAPLQFATQNYTCQPVGAFHINDVIDGDTAIKFSDVTQILTPIVKY